MDEHRTGSMHMRDAAQRVRCSTELPAPAIQWASQGSNAQPRSHTITSMGQWAPRLKADGLHVCGNLRDLRHVHGAFHELLVHNPQRGALLVGRFAVGHRGRHHGLQQQAPVMQFFSIRTSTVIRRRSLQR